MEESQNSTTLPQLRTTDYPAYKSDLITSAHTDSVKTTYLPLAGNQENSTSFENASYPFLENEISSEKEPNLKTATTIKETLKSLNATAQAWYLDTGQKNAVNKTPTDNNNVTLSDLLMNYGKNKSTTTSLLPKPYALNRINDSIFSSVTHSNGLLQDHTLDYSNYFNDNNSTALYNNASNYTDTKNDTMEFDGWLSGYTLEHIILAAIFVTLLMLVIVIGNCLVIWAIAVDRNLKQIQNWFIASLAVSDLLVGLLIMPFSLANELMGYWYFGNILCELWLSVDVLLCTASILNLCLISLDRYWSITKAIAYVRQRTKKRVIIMITMVWVLSCIICFPPLVGWKRPQPKSHGLPLCVLSEDIGYIIYSTMGSFYIPLVVLIVVYFKIYLAARERARRNLKAKQKKKAAQPGNGNATTTTSFTTKPNAKNIPEEDFSSDEFPSHLTEEPSSDKKKHEEAPKEPPLSVSNPHTELKPIDENRKLLSDTEVTDSACDSPKKTLAPDGVTPKPSSDTDGTTSDYICKQNKFNGYKNGSKAEENMKPLLEDSQVESDSQKEHGTIKNTDVKNTHKEITNKSDIKNSKKKSKRDDKKHFMVSFRRVSSHLKQNKSASTRPTRRGPDDPERMKRKLAKYRERRATIVLGIVMGTFILCWFPFFCTYVISSLAGLFVHPAVFAVFFWAGYCNSALNPLIYTVFNQDFRKAFQRIIFGARYR